MPETASGRAESQSAAIDSVLMTALHILTFDGQRPLTNASGFFFERDERLFLVTSRHVLFDEPSGHYPDRIQIELHTDESDIGASTGFSILLYRNGTSNWLEAADTGGAVDIAAIEIDRDALPKSVYFRAFTPQHLLGPDEQIEIGTSLQIVGFPLGFHDTLHHLPVSRQAGVASSFGFRFQGLGYFLTDARTHRGTSGAPVVMRVHDRDDRLGDLTWLLLGVHSARLDIGTRDLRLDEALGLNCSWYADILMTLTKK